MVLENSPTVTTSMKRLMENSFTVTTIMKRVLQNSYKVKTCMKRVLETSSTVNIIKMVLENSPHCYDYAFSTIIRNHKGLFFQFNGIRFILQPGAFVRSLTPNIVSRHRPGGNRPKRRRKKSQVFPETKTGVQGDEQLDSFSYVQFNGIRFILQPGAFVRSLTPNIVSRHRPGGNRPKRRRKKITGISRDKDGVQGDEQWDSFSYDQVETDTCH
ncbi:hypothetical protein CEXT_43801 [Caerostris extrusa]|uniref:Uncharacterized protein n=1 Tax=Caerostris extrusa TaxID=172846 RepID=A0AAV4WB36_CAEEX|nr:hypothetical protein CEXT_43801 [Caerostris extrusa]